MKPHQARTGNEYYLVRQAPFCGHKIPTNKKTLCFSKIIWKRHTATITRKNAQEDDVRNNIATKTTQAAKSQTMTLCTVCYEHILPADMIELTATCRHKFCRQCLLTWFETSHQQSCLLCLKVVRQSDVLRITKGMPLSNPLTKRRQEEEVQGNHQVDYFTLTWLQENDARQCPGCDAWIVRSQGCDHMICRCKCDFNFGVALLAKDWDGQCLPLVAAYKVKKHKTVEQVLDKSKNKTELRRQFQQLFAQAFADGELEFVEYLLEHNAMPKVAELTMLFQPNAAARSMTAACRENNFDRVRWLLHACPSLVNAKGEDRMTPLYHACLEGNTAVIELLLARGASDNVDELRYDKDTTLTQAMAQACAHGNLPRVRWLVRLFPALLTAKFNDELPFCYAYLYYAQREGHEDVIQYLLTLAGDAVGRQTGK